MYKINFSPTKQYLEEKEIIAIHDDFMSNDYKRFKDNEKYYNGNNSTILERTIMESNTKAPDWRIPIPYGRKLINTISGYMFKPSLIKYEIKDSTLKSELEDIFIINKEPIKTSNLGIKSSMFGVGYELHYVSNENGKVVPKWSVVDPYEIIPIYNYDIDPKLICFIRFYKISNYNANNRKVETILEVYYSDLIYTYKRIDEKDKNDKIKTSLDQEGPPVVNVYQEPPLAIYKNNDGWTGDFEHVKSLIDAYDILCSDSMNEFDRFAWAYLLIANQGINEEDVEKLKQRRIFENLENTDAIKFLTKDINNEFISFMAEWIKNEIHLQTHIPDFLSQSIGDRASGVALDRLLYSLEFICTTKENLFKDGLYQRVKLIDKITNVSNDDLIHHDINIIMKRNKPSDLSINADAYTKLDGRGISRETLQKNLLDFIDDPVEEKKKYDKEQEEMRKQQELDFENMANQNSNDSSNMMNNQNQTNSQNGDTSDEVVE